MGGCVDGRKLMSFRRLLLLVACLGIGSATFVSAQDPPKPPPTPAAKPIDIAGKWSMAMVTSMFNANVALEFKQDGEKISGTYSGRYGVSPLQGTIKKNAIEFVVSIDAEGTPTKMTFWGEVAADGQSITKGTADISGLGDVSWTAARAKSGN
jgi:hypothetical protein